MQRKSQKSNGIQREIDFLIEIFTDEALSISEILCHWSMPVLFFVLCQRMSWWKKREREYVVSVLSIPSRFSYQWKIFTKLKMTNHHQKIGVNQLDFSLSMNRTLFFLFSNHILCYWKSVFQYTFTCRTRRSLCVWMFNWWWTCSSNFVRNETIVNKTSIANLCCAIVWWKSVL